MSSVSYLIMPAQAQSPGRAAHSGSVVPLRDDAAAPPPARILDNGLPVDLACEINGHAFIRDRVTRQWRWVPADTVRRAPPMVVRVREDSSVTLYPEDRPAWLLAPEGQR